MTPTYTKLAEEPHQTTAKALRKSVASRYTVTDGGPDRERIDVCVQAHPLVSDAVLCALLDAEADKYGRAVKRRANSCDLWTREHATTRDNLSSFMRYYWLALGAYEWPALPVPLERQWWSLWLLKR